MSGISGLGLTGGTVAVGVVLGAVPLAVAAPIVTVATRIVGVSREEDGLAMLVKVTKGDGAPLVGVGVICQR